MGRLLAPFRKIGHIIREMSHLIRQERAYFFAPLLIMLALLAIFIFYVGQPVIVTFIYAGL